MAYSYSTKTARKGKDVSKPGKNFSKISRKAGGGKIRKRRGRG